ncbi:MAG TPA: nuclear transport factor 2 family protein [Allosphingosinicella sp.]
MITLSGRAALLGFVLATSSAASAQSSPSSSSPAPSAAARTPAFEAAAATVDAFHAALRRGDTAAAANLIADDALIFEEGGAERSKAEYQAHHLDADAAFSKAVNSVRTRRTGRASGDTAWVATEGRVTGTFNGRAVDRTTVETMVLRRTRNGWRIVHIHWSSR